MNKSGRSYDWIKRTHSLMKSGWSKILIESVLKGPPIFESMTVWFRRPSTFIWSWWNTCVIIFVRILVLIRAGWICPSEIRLVRSISAVLSAVFLKLFITSRPINPDFYHAMGSSPSGACCQPGSLDSSTSTSSEYWLIYSRLSRDNIYHVESERSLMKVNGHNKYDWDTFRMKLDGHFHLWKL